MTIGASVAKMESDRLEAARDDEELRRLFESGNSVEDLALGAAVS